MNRKEKTMKKFAEFLPEVQTDEIDLGWEKIRYFLPEEKKRRGLIFFRRGTWILAAGLIGVVSLYFVFHHNSLPTQTAHRLQKKKNIPAVEPGGENRKNNLITLNSLEPVQIFTVQSTNANMHPAGKNIQKLPENKNEVAQRNPGETQVYIEAESLAKIKRQTDIPNPGSFAGSGSGYSFQRNDEKKVLHLIPIEIQISTIPQDPECNTSLRDQFPILPARNVFAELTGGLNITAQYARENGTRTIQRHFNPNVNAGIVYQFSNKVNLNCLFAFEGNNFTDDRSKTGILVNKKTAKPSVGPLSQADTTVQYTNGRLKNTLTANTSMMLNIGAGYSLMQKRRWLLDVTLQVGVRYTTYRAFTGTEGSVDTMYYHTSSAAPAGEQLSPVPPIQEKINTFQLGIVPGVTLGYQVNAHLWLILKPFYFTQINENKIRWLGDYRLRQESLYLNAGVRMRF